MSEWQTAGAAEGEDGEVREVELGGTYVALVRTGGEWFALAADCSHEDCPLADGEVRGTAIVCNCHGSEFDVRTGEVLVGPATEPVQTYPVRVADGRLEVQA